MTRFGISTPTFVYTPPHEFEKTITISPAGGDYETIQDALDANPHEFTLFQVYPGVYANDTIHFTANNQSVIGLDNSTTQILGSVTTNVVDFGAYTGCVLNRVTVRITGATSAVHTVTGSTGNIIINDCTLEMTNASVVGGTQPSVINITGAGTCTVEFGFINYTNAVAVTNPLATVKSAIRLGTGSFVNLRRGRVVITCSGVSLGTTLAYGTTTGEFTANRTVIDVTDPDGTYVVGFYIVGSSIADEFINCDLHVTGAANTAIGIWNNGTGSIRVFGNSIHVVAAGGTANSFMIVGGATIHSVWNDVIAAAGVSNAGTYTTTMAVHGAAAAIADGDPIVHGLGTTPAWVNVTGSDATTADHISVNTIGAAHFHVAIKKVVHGEPITYAAGTTQTIYWSCGV